MICTRCAQAADCTPGAAHCDEPANPGRDSWACTCQHRTTDRPEEQPDN